ncbi:Hint domain-containing protein [Frigidibacter sp.]|uniref:Hint domain-containing protein n=1 Tax=Frigidibacter sp. TaxID=2586418 RepID=UPI002732C5E1|nr:Hint domain-containing protein [Frigidibacter sp.]MDP3339528.1 Hint domain-containing protein [Frigidibacter sp.]
MAQSSIQIISTDSVTVTHADGSPTRNGNVIENALNGNAFGWEVPDNLSITVSTAAPVTISFDDADGVLTDDPVSGARVVDQRLTAPVTIDGVTYTPNDTTIRWQNPAPVYVENEYEVVLFDAAGTAYTMVGVSITTGYSTTVVGVMFDGAAPPAGTTLYYIQGKSSYTGLGQSTAIGNATICFLRGTLIDTPQGRIPVQDLMAGDAVTTMDHGVQPIRWIGSSRVSGLGALAPIRIGAGALGNDRDLLVSPNHRMLLTGPRAELLFGEREVLMAAKFLTADARVRAEPCDVAEYYHILFDRHEIIFAEGAPAESLHMGGEAISALEAEARAEIAAIFPDLQQRTAGLSRPALTRVEAQVLMAA